MNTNTANASFEAAKTPTHQQAYERLRALILFGDLAPGQAVTIQGLTEALEVGMTPVREALRRLIAEGALIHQGNRRVIVPTLSRDCVEELGFMRETLEPELTRRATRRIDADRIEALRTCDAALNLAIDRGDVGGYLTNNYQFHSMIYETANAPIMAATVDRLWLQFGPSLRVVCGRFGTSNLPDQHAALLEAMATGDIEGAAEAMMSDIAQGIRQITEAIEN